MTAVAASLSRARLTSVGRSLFGVALLGLGLEHFIFLDFVTGRAQDWPSGVPGKMVWVYASGAMIALTGLTILVGRRGRSAALGVGLMVFVWGFLRHLPIVAADSLLGGSWTRAGKALAIFGGCFAIAATLPPLSGETNWRRYANANDLLVLLGRIGLGSFLVVAGMQHFKFTVFAASLIPAWFPGDALWWVRFAGVALIAGGLGLLVPRTAALAGLLSGLMIFSWFWIVHLPRTFLSVSDGIALFEALAVSGIALVIAGHERRPAPTARGAMTFPAQNLSASDETRNEALRP